MFALGVPVSVTTPALLTTILIQDRSSPEGLLSTALVASPPSVNIIGASASPSHNV